MDPYDKEALTAVEERHLKRVQSSITHCIYCQPFDGGEAIWILGERTELSELLYKLKVPEKSWYSISENLYCPYCGSDVFDISSDVGIKSQYDINIDKKYEKANRICGKEVGKFQEFIETYPLLSYSSNFGKKIYIELATNKFPVVSIDGIFYRARPITSEVIDSSQMSNPPIGTSNEGRFNHAGQSHLYLSSSPESAAFETSKTKKGCVVWLIKNKVLNADKILDLTFDYDYVTPTTSIIFLSLQMSGSLYKKNGNQGLWKPDYVLTRYIMDCAKSLGFNGIKYNSILDGEYNLVFFHPNELNIKPLKDPSIFTFKKVSSSG